MRQRVMIAMALACAPRLLLADEPTTALDVTIQAQILELLRKLQEDKGMSVMLITHDLGVVAENADVVAVMYAGRIVEYGDVETVFKNPMHPYTQGLFRSMPVMGQTHGRLEVIPGTVPNPANLPSGCPFHPRCDRAREVAAKSSEEQLVQVRVAGSGEEQDTTHKLRKDCVEQDPALLEIERGHWVACWHAHNYQHGRPSKPDLRYRRGAEAAPAGA
jgi:oligopeptide/dipeptide ABC transporter ATP-binding protein